MKRNDSIFPDFGAQASLFDTPPAPHFNGPDYVPALDQKRLSTQNDRIRDFMLDGRFRTLQEIETALGFPQASISAQLRHLKKPRFGAYTLNKRRRKLAGLFEYQLRK